MSIFFAFVTNRPENTVILYFNKMSAFTKLTCFIHSYLPYTSFFTEVHRVWSWVEMTSCFTLLLASLYKYSPKWTKQEENCCV